ncbi:MAG: M20/M25/M40 family metallo-hydrolase [Gemmataceae bacterium]|jgi:acetylornithine deacetylase/succinyl-diaminopimelate desuccinylase-like protein|nr:M20/M25/M40 family metallo-hydrolase [Gemmataceae bacterium]
MMTPLDWLQKNHEGIVRNLAELVSVPSISTDGEHGPEIDKTASLTCQQMREAGLQNVEILRVGHSLPYAYGEWLDAPGKPTVFLYAHHDVQPINYREQWLSDPWHLTRRDGRLYGRGSADDKGAIAAQLGAIAAYLKTQGSLPVNVKMLVEGEEEIGSKNLLGFFERHKQKLQSDVIVVCDTENVEVGLPCITYSLRGIVAAHVEVKSAEIPVHSGMAGGALPDAAIALNAILGRLYWGNGPLPISGMYDAVRPITEKERSAFRRIPGDESKWRKEYGIAPNTQLAIESGLTAYEQTWRRPSVTVIAQEASSIKGASNQVLPKAQAIVSCRIVPDQEPAQVFESLKNFLTKDPPWGVQVTVKEAGPPVKWWITDPNGPAFEAALAAMRKGFDRDPIAIGCGGTIGFVGPLAELFGGAPALLMGIEDPASNAHAPNESLHEGDFKKLMASLVNLFENLGKLSANKVK